MPNIYLVHGPDDVWACFLQNDDGTMGFQWCTEAWGLLLRGAWLWKKAEEKFVSLKDVDLDGRVMACRKELRRWALTLIRPSEGLLATFAQIESYGKHRRRANLYRRYHREITIPEAPTLWSLLTEDNPRAVGDELSAQAEVCHVWRFSDRGIWFQAIGPSVKDVVYAVSVEIDIPVVLLKSVDDVPTW